LAREAAKQIQSRVAEVKAEPECQTLEKNLNELARKIVNEYRNREKEYDQRTDHGAKQGASLFHSFTFRTTGENIEIRFRDPH
jgi:predicted secreted Zn-dependent protease